ncbi:SUN domain-containing ossification factor isoform X2 [Calliphora vicina]|uniref:SUN domain-containing ossification factor isoform X2 n=1 Tax=Calliphora vicina TaxID=7373 RepID=UPI00325BDCC7
MRLNLHLTHWSLLFITLISSCFLFYVVASENAKYVTTKHLRDASVASNAHIPPTHPSTATSSTTAATNTPTLQSAGVTNAPAAGDQRNDDKNALNEDKNDKILPNYKKVKKLISEQQPASLQNDDIASTTEPSPPEAHILSTPSVMTSVEHSEMTDEIIKSSSDSVFDGDDDDNNINSNSVDNKNVFNTIDTTDSENVKANNEIHSSIEEPTDTNSPQQVPDVEQPAEQGIIIQQHVQDDNADMANGLPDITDIPTVTVTELPLEVLQQPQNTLDSVIIDDGGGDRSSEERVNRTIEVIPETEEEIQKDEQIVKINDSGGGVEGSADSIQPTPTTASPTTDDQEVISSMNNIPTDTNNINTTQSSSINASVEQQQQQQQNASSSTSASQVNLTAAEEVPMPVFSEWAQKQMEAAEKQQALEQEQTVNNSAQRKNNTNGNGKPTALKIRAKNYASPDCGAKIIASSAYTSNAGAVLSSSKDEYMLSLCGNRIWFVVELCEAIQAQKIDFANFELYSSSPQNFTVAVSKRFPTREWSNVGRFEAEDKRTVQSFDLHPHLFGKFVRVDINSHYSKEHFCTLSLFRVFGTSEFEAFETENHPNDDLDDFDDEYLLEQNTVKHAESNLFKSASDAVLSIVKKATEVLGKPANNQNQTFKTQPKSVVCRTPIYGLFSCAECPTSLVEKINNILTCEFSQLNLLLSNKGIRNDLLNTQICAKLYGIETKQVLTTQKDIKKSFYVNILPNEYVGALCQLLARPKTLGEKPNNSYVEETNQHNEATELPSNLTIDKKFGKEDLNLLDHPEKKLMKPEIPTLPVEPTKPSTNKSPEVVETSTDINLDDSQQLPRPLEPEAQLEATTLPPKIIQKPNLPDTNIFNVPADEPSSTETEVPVADPDTPASVENFEQAATTAPTTTTPSPTPASNIDPVNAPLKSEEDSNSWDNIDNLLTTVPSTLAGGSAQYNQPKNSNGPQSESVFIRLSNRIKALERNMSLSGQYLEELSRRYKKQVEELHQTLTQQIQTVRTLEEENRRHHELEQSYAERNTQLKNELDDLKLHVHACIVVIIFVGAFVFFVLMVGILFYRALSRETKEVLSIYDKGSKKKNVVTASVTSSQKKINRRKSFEDFSERDQDASNVSGSYVVDKFRRPSEAAMLILKECKGDGTLIKTELQEGEECVHNNPTTSTTRQRKLSVCYGSNSNINQSNNQSAGLPPIHPQKSQIKRKGEKHSWPNTAQAQLQAWQHLEELNADEHIGDSAEISSMRMKKPAGLNGKSKKKKESQSFKRQQSSPAETSLQLNSSTPTELKGAEFDERLMLDEDDLDNFIPNADLAYNEFMPDGPRGYQCVNPNSNANNPASKKTSASKQLVDSNLKKSRRLSSPVFFKSPFTKSLKVGDLSKT